MFLNSNKLKDNMHTALQINNILLKITSADRGLSRKRISGGFSYCFYAIGLFKGCGDFATALCFLRE